MRQTQILSALCLLAFGWPTFAAIDGKQLYGSHCAACHGSNGMGGVGIPLALPTYLEIVTEKYLVNSIRLGRPGRVMPAFTRLTDSEVQAIVKYIFGWYKGKKEPLPNTPIKGDITNGAKLFTQYCAECHGVNGEGGSGTGVSFSRHQGLPIIPPALLNSGFLASASDQMHKMTLVKGRMGTPMVSFKKKGLTDQQLNDIVAYVRNFEKLLQFFPDQEKTEPPILSYTSSSSFEQTVENIREAIVSANFSLIKTQSIDNGLSNPKKEDKKKTIIYFCNFTIINELLKLDPRVGVFLPCRVTIVELEGKVKIMSINPKIFSTHFNNDELTGISELLYDMYRKILEDSVL